MNPFSYKGGRLYAENVDTESIARSVGTPFYCYSASAIGKKYALFADMFAGMDCVICYAMKANSNQAVLRLLARAGAGMDIVSQGELRRALKAGATPDRIVFSGVGKTRNEMCEALAAGIFCINVESVSELRLLSEVARAVGCIAPVSVRINPDIDSRTHAKMATGSSETKFGIPWREAGQAYHEAATLPNIRVMGVDLHIGSQILSLDRFDAAFALLAEFVGTLRADGHRIEHVDLGGGLGISGDWAVDVERLAAYAKIVGARLGKLGCRLVFEPGRFIVGDAGILVTEILHVKQGAGKNFLVVDAAMNDLIRPTLYDAHHEIMPVREATAGSATIEVDIVGPICETGDYLCLSRKIPEAQRGDLLALCSAGAYGAVLSGTYNSRLLIPEILVREDRFDVVRPRPSYDTLIGLDRIPGWLS